MVAAWSCGTGNVVVMHGWLYRPHGMLHVSLSNLPLYKWSEGVTFCHLRGRLSRKPESPRPYQKDRICRLCVNEMVEMGERVPEWMKEV